MSPCAPATCSVNECAGLVKAIGLCNRHYLRHTRYGDALAGAPARSMSVVDQTGRMWARIDKDGPGGCWIYRGPLTSGYGTHTIAGRPWRVHRFVYTLLVGEIPDGKTLDHLCHTRDGSCAGGRSCPHRACCNPAHLEPVTLAENTQRGIRTRRQNCQLGHPYDMEIRRRGGVERRCSTCQQDRRKKRTERAREARVSSGDAA